MSAPCATRRRKVGGAASPIAVTLECNHGFASTSTLFPFTAERTEINATRLEYHILRLLLLLLSSFYDRKINRLRDGGG